MNEKTVSTEQGVEADRVLRTLGRRGFLGVSATAVGAALFVTACGDDGDTGSGSGTTSAPDSGGSTTTTGSAEGDAAIATLAAGLEVLAVGTYKAALDAATAGKLGEVPPAVAEFVTTAMAHHEEHLDAWNGVLESAGAEAVTEPNATLKPTVDAEFAKVKDVVGAAKLALMLEQIAAATYLSAIPAIEDPDAITLAGGIQLIDMQHAAVLNFVLGEYPVPDVFARVDMAVSS